MTDSALREFTETLYLEVQRRVRSSLQLIERSGATLGQADAVLKGSSAAGRAWAGDRTSTQATAGPYAA